MGIPELIGLRRNAESVCPHTLLPLVSTLQPSVQWRIFSFLEFQLTFAGDEVICLLMKRFNKRIAAYFLKRYEGKNKS